MTDRHAFLRAIRENPDDDLSRLVYADWLEEHGEPERAELIRVQIEIAKLDEYLSRPATYIGLHRREELRRRERELIDSLYPGHLWSPRDPFRRGIMEEFACGWEAWRDTYADRFWERELPWRVRLTTRPDWFAEPTGLVNVGLYGLPDDQIPAVLAARWPGIDFELPPVREEGAYACPADTDRDGDCGRPHCPNCRPRRQQWVDRRPREQARTTIRRRIAERHGVPTDRMIELRPGRFDSPAWEVICHQCSTPRLILDTIAREISPDETTFRTTTCLADRFLVDLPSRGSRSRRVRTVTPCYHGRCSCGQVYYAIGEPEDAPIATLPPSAFARPLVD